MKFLQINHRNVNILEDFISEIGTSSETFRYYTNREPKKAIKSHLITLLLLDSDCVAYGHLDKEGDDIWLGICVKDDKIGKGYGNIVMKKLTTFYDGEIKLSVDSRNSKAISLYKKFSFEEEKRDEGIVFMKKNDTNL